MNKKIIVSDCFNCPFCESIYKNGKVIFNCVNPETKNYEIPNENKISYFCELVNDEN